MNRDVRMVDVLREVNRARKAMNMVPLKEVPKGFLGRPAGSLAIALGASGAMFDSSCDHCGVVSGRVLFLKEIRGAVGKVVALRGIWRRAYFKEMPGGYYVGLPRVLARFQKNFNAEMYPELVIEQAKKVAA